MIFDFDGTLAHMSIDFDAMREAVNELFSKYHISPESLKARYILERIDETFKRIHRSDPVRAHRIREEALSLIETMELQAASKSHLLPGIYPRLWRLWQKGVRLAIASRNCEKALYKVLGKAYSFFDIIVTRENSTAYKPEKAALTPILQRFSLPKSRIFMIGDHPMDILAARRASILPVGVLTGTGSREDLLKARPLYLFKHTLQAIDVLFGTDCALRPRPVTP